MSERTPQVGDRVFHFQFGINVITELDNKMVYTSEYQFLTSKLTLHPHIDNLWVYTEDYSLYPNPMRARMMNKLMELFYNVSTPVASGGIKTARFNQYSDYAGMSDAEFLEAYNNVLRCAYKPWA